MGFTGKDCGMMLPRNPVWSSSGTGMSKPAAYNLRRHTMGWILSEAMCRGLNAMAKEQEERKKKERKKTKKRKRSKTGNKR